MVPALKSKPTKQVGIKAQIRQADSNCLFKAKILQLRGAGIRFPDTYPVSGQDSIKLGYLTNKSII